LRYYQDVSYHQNHLKSKGFGISKLTGAEPCIMKPLIKYEMTDARDLYRGETPLGKALKRRLFDLWVLQISTTPEGGRYH